MDCPPPLPRPNYRVKFGLLTPWWVQPRISHLKSIWPLLSLAIEPAALWRLLLLRWSNVLRILWMEVALVGSWLILPVPRLDGSAGWTVGAILCLVLLVVAGLWWRLLWWCRWRTRDCFGRVIYIERFVDSWRDGVNLGAEFLLDLVKIKPEPVSDLSINTVEGTANTGHPN